jgi:hypothetical protein
MTHLITFTDKSMTIAAEICKASALANGCDKATIYRPHDIDPDFMWDNRDILSQKRGAGYWLWKPYLIDRELKRMNDGEYLVYADAGVEFVNGINHIIDRMAGDIWLFGNMWQHVHFCKADVFVPILSNQYYNYLGKQCQASVIVIRNTVYSRLFVHDWLKWCCQPGIIDDSPSKLPNHAEFQDHRHDQAVVTCLAIRHNVPLHWWPAMYNAGNFTYEKTGYNDTYPVLFHHHRLRNSDFTATDDLNRHMQIYFKSKYLFV